MSGVLLTLLENARLWNATGETAWSLLNLRPSGAGVYHREPVPVQQLRHPSISSLEQAKLPDSVPPIRARHCLALNPKTLPLALKTKPAPFPGPEP